MVDIFVARIVGGEPLRDLRPQVGEVRDLRLVELLHDARLDQPREVAVGGDDDVIAGAAGQQLRLHHLLGIVDVVDDLDAGLLGEVVEHAFADIVGPVVDVDDLLLRRRGEREGGECGCCEQPLGNLVQGHTSDGL